ncbi:hypothetical protein ES702_02205 [subsurface metagenome]
MPQAKWKRINPAGLLVLAQPGGAMLMATSAKKHVTLFIRSRRAPGAGHPDVKAAFAAAARGTVGVLDRSARNATIASAVRGKGPGRRVYRSKSKAHPGKIIKETPTR